MIAALPGDDTFRTSPERGLPTAARVDRKTRTIFGAKAMQIGPLNAGDARPWKVDATSLSQLESLTNQRNVGIKSRFAHPNMSQDGMGRHLGRITNARRVENADGDYTAVDLTMSDAATRSPRGNIADYVLDLAEQSPEDFGLSIAPLLDREAMSKVEPDEAGLVPIRIKGLRAIDVVDEPAATRGGLFSLDSDSLADLPAQASHLLDTFFADSPADVIRGRFGAFLDTYLRNRGDDMATDAKPNAELEAANTKIAELTAKVAELSAKPKPTEVPPELSKDEAAARAELAKVARRSEVDALCTLAKVDDKTKALFHAANFSRAEAQAYLKDSGFLSTQNPPIGEGGTDLGESKKKPEETFAAEFEKDSVLFSRMGLTKDQYIKSRLQDAA